MQGESSHACTNEPFTARVRLRATRMLIRAHVTPVSRTRKQGRVFARRRRKIWKLGSETVEFWRKNGHPYNIGQVIQVAL